MPVQRDDVTESDKAYKQAHPADTKRKGRFESKFQFDFIDHWLDIETTENLEK